MSGSEDDLKHKPQVLLSGQTDGLWILARLAILYA